MENKESIIAILGIVAIVVVVSVVFRFEGIPGRNYRAPTGRFTDDGTAPRTWDQQEINYPCTEGKNACVQGTTGANLMRCTRGLWKLVQFCSANTVCDARQGCIPIRLD